jgi:hypothetical protein
MAPIDMTILPEEPPCFTSGYQSKWSDDDDSICLEYSEDGDGSHELYLLKDGRDFRMPVVFEDGMDFIECELYYASIESQMTGGALRCLQNQQQRRLCNRDITGPLNSTSLPSCLRNPRTKKKKTREGTPQRRCSFGGLPKCGEVEPTLVRSNSVRALGDGEPRRVCFEQYVQVSNIHSVDDYPTEIRSLLWMSRQEMMISMRRAMVDDLQERQRREQEQQDPATQEQHEGDDILLI